MLLRESEEDGYSREYGQFFFCCFTHLKDCVSHCLWIKSPLIAIGFKVAPYLTAKTGYGVKQLRSPSAWTWTVCTKFLSFKNLSLSPFILWILLIPYDAMNSKPCFTGGTLPHLQWSPHWVWERRKYELLVWWLVAFVKLYPQKHCTSKALKRVKGDFELTLVIFFRTCIWKGWLL